MHQIPGLHDVSCDPVQFILQQYSSMSLEFLVLLLVLVTVYRYRSSGSGTCLCTWCRTALRLSGLGLFTPPKVVDAVRGCCSRHSCHDRSNLSKSSWSFDQTSTVEDVECFFCSCSSISTAVGAVYQLQRSAGSRL